MLFRSHFPCREHRAASSLGENYNVFVAGIRFPYAISFMGGSKEIDETTFGSRKALFWRESEKTFK